MKLIRSEIRGEASREMSVTQFRVLANINLHDTITVSELACLIGVSTAAMSRMVTELVKKRFVTREVSSSDRRQIVLKLSAKGKIYFARIKGDVELKLNQRFKSLSDTKCDRIVRSLLMLEKMMT